MTVTLNNHQLHNYQSIMNQLIDNAILVHGSGISVNLYSGSRRGGKSVGAAWKHCPMNHYVGFPRKGRKWTRKERRNGRYVGDTFNMLFPANKMPFETLKGGISVLHGTKPIPLDEAVAWTSAWATIKLRACNYGAELVLSPPRKEWIAVLRAWRLGCRDEENDASRPTPSVA